jgi:hypothetical protein
VSPGTPARVPTGISPYLRPVATAVAAENPDPVVVGTAQQAGYLLVTVHEDTGTFDGIGNVLNASTGKRETGDAFTISAR